MNRLTPLLYIFMICCGVWLGQNSWDRLTFVYVGSERSPAAFRGLRDFSSLKGASLLDAASDQLSDQIQMKLVDGGYEVKLSQFVLRSPEGHKTFACKIDGRLGVYNRVELVLDGYGVSEHGKSPRLVLQTECKSDESTNSIGQITVFIPMDEILKLKTIDQQISGFRGSNLNVELRQMTSVWPDEWVLEKVRYFQEGDTRQDMVLEPNKKSSRKGAFSFRWNSESKN